MSLDLLDPTIDNTLLGPFWKWRRNRTQKSSTTPRLPRKQASTQKVWKDISQSWPTHSWAIFLNHTPDPLGPGKSYRRSEFKSARKYIICQVQHSRVSDDVRIMNWREGIEELFVEFGLVLVDSLTLSLDTYNDQCRWQQFFPVFLQNTLRYHQSYSPKDL